ncbi:MAG: hypothetical protein CMB80_30355 [Flammeovirgaceae bacterium]|nr:hypothetical protein [Flammeovirgaceae bacterium]MBR08182.1 hypothetical protein [Rickettsiales bacterium]HCX20768.1 hypothetical protein [Cytophagales bacterium]|tara:strand:- start:1 stop:963 length:963 start_codon:yes stop_codon:yes gene_type:complete
MASVSITFIEEPIKPEFMKYSILSFFFFVSVVGFGQKIKSETVIYEDTLGMDIFTPLTKNANKPVLIYVHGGGFSGGKRDQEQHIEFCKRYAAEGWVTATISYHLTMKGQSFSCDQPVQNKINTMFVAAQNINQSVAYLLQRKDELGIDPNKIVVAGSSAGAEAVLHAVYWPKTQEGILPSDFKYGGMISMAGALLDKRWVTNESAVPSLFYHGTCDQLVPYDNASHHYCSADQTGFMMLYGAYSLAMKLKDLDEPYYLVTDCGGGHEWASKPIQEKYRKHMDLFLEWVIKRDGTIQGHSIISEGTKQCDFVDFGFCSPN